MKYKIAIELKKILLSFILIMLIISSLGQNYIIVKASESDSLNGVVFIGDSRLGDPVKSKLEAEGATVFKCVASNPQQWNSVTSSGSGTVTTKNESINVSFPDKSKVSAVAIQLGVNDINSIGSYKTVVSNLKSLYPDATIYCMSIIYCNGGYEYLNSSLITYNNELKNYCTGKVKYVDTNSGICSNNKLDMSYSGDGLHLNSSGATKFVDNIKSKISGSSEKSAEMTVTEASKSVADWCIEFYKKYGRNAINRLTYGWSGSPSYNRIQIHDFSTEEFQEKLNGSCTMRADCVGWVALSWHRGSGIDMWTCRYDPGGGDAIGGCYGLPGSICANEYFKEFSLSSADQLIPGDILVAYDHHVAVYVGEFDDNGTTKDVIEMGTCGLTANKLSSSLSTWRHFDAYVRLVSYDGVTWDGVTGLDGTYNGGYDKESVDLDSIQKKLKYSGLPKTIVYSGSKAFPDIFDFLKGLLDWLVGLLFLGLKIVAMGLTELCENIVNDIMKLVNNTVISS